MTPREDDHNPWSQLAQMRQQRDEARARLHDQITDRCLPPGTIGYEACHAGDHAVIADLRRQLEEAIGQRDHYARRALEAERRVELYEASLVMLAKEMDRPREPLDSDGADA